MRLHVKLAPSEVNFFSALPPPTSLYDPASLRIWETLNNVNVWDRQYVKN